MKRAYVYFWDGYRMGCRIITHDDGLEARIKAVLILASGVGQATAMFVGLDLNAGIPTEVWRARQEVKSGDDGAAMEGEAECPRATWGDNQLADYPQAGVFLVNLTTRECRIIGGIGFSDADCNPNQLREVTLAAEEDDEDRDNDSAASSAD